MSNNVQYSAEEIEAQKQEIARLEAEKIEALKQKKREAKGPSRKEIKEINAKQKAAIMESMSEAEYETMQLQKMRYMTNAISYKLGYLGIACSLTAGFIALNSIAPAYFLNGFGVVIAILLNIIILLAGFLSAEKVKTYSLEYSKFMIGLGAVCILRMFWYPRALISLYSQVLSKAKDGISYETLQSEFTNKLGNSMLGLRTDADGVAVGFKTTSYLTANGYVRGIIIIVFLAIAAAAFICSGVIGIKKSKQLHSYLDTIKED